MPEKGTIMNIAASICGLIACFLVISTPALARDAGPVVTDHPAAGASLHEEVKADNVQPAPETPDSPEDVDVTKTAGALVSALRAGKWLAALGLALMLIGAFLRKLVSFVKKDFADSKLGGKVIGAGSAFAIAFGFGVYAELGVVAALMGAVGVALAAAGIKSLAPSKK